MLALGAVAGCSEPAPVWLEGRAYPSASAGARSGPAAAPGSPDRFVAAIRRELPELALDRRDEEIADLGLDACSPAAAGRQDELTASGVSAAQARRLREVALTDLCPR
ncbi:hypothetical protein BJY16_004442 [Actinoplanes octamycinicus]|uniref:DUF732 domain-containing protein n=1 Tax=Actinoplanes octamycinicus TaxID=135948 RepID=A0A7W7GZ71_9ACTN|nr:hypothetical protein [Actinoplanes octamycinicus]MBB4740983.1 hypothetical protein [Actinoplanes octamycinicus]GIE55890.1 hypothetical protein Aoc01nite_12920 [Actinoplanes octamycinicus]